MATKYKGSIKLPAGLSKMGDGNYKLIDANDINICSSASTENQDKALVEVMDSVSLKIGEIETLLNKEPVLSYIDEDGYRAGEKKYWAIGDPMSVKFKFESPAAGNTVVTILRNGLTYKTVTTAKGLISIELGTALETTSYTYTISAADSIGRSAPTTLSFIHVLGGVTLTSNFAQASARASYSAAESNIITVPATISYAEQNYPRIITYTIIDLTTEQQVTSGEYNCGLNNWNNSFAIENVVLPSAGNYKLLLQGKVPVGDATLLSSILEFRFNALPANTIAITVLETSIKPELMDTDSISIKYRINTNILVAQTQNALKAICTLYKNEVVVKTITVNGLTHGDSATWNIGRLAHGDYTYVIRGDLAGGGTYTDQYAQEVFAVTESSTYGNAYITDGLYAYFNPNSKDNNDPDPSIWKMENSGLGAYYYFKLHNLNYKSNGWILDQEDSSKMLKFTGKSYGELRYNDGAGSDVPIAPLNFLANSATGNSLEIMFKTRCIGDQNSVVLSCRNELIANYGGYTVKYDKAKISSHENFATTTMVEEKWTHVVFVIDKNLRRLKNEVDNSTIEDLNPVYTMNIYVDGVRTKVISIDEFESFATLPQPAMQLMLNAYLNSTLNQLEGFGACEIKTIRLYNKALKASEVLTNFINANFSIEKRNILIAKNDPSKANIPVIRMVRNATISNGQRSYGQYSADKSFEVLNSITIKEDKAHPEVPTSKNSWVNCTLWYTYLDTATNTWVTKHWHDVDVYLQGTSSLQYPIKNYKIKLFNTADSATVRGGKLKTVPFNMSNKEGWYCTDSVFTLKCDYMEESHKNNTPTAMLYETIVDEVMQTQDPLNRIYTPSKDPRYADYLHTYQNEVDETVSVRKYRDAIAGFPVLVYYNENAAIEDALPVDYNSAVYSSDIQGYYENPNDVLVGTLMFNVDKTGSALGFKVPFANMGDMQDRILGVKGVDIDGTTHYLVTSPLDIDKEPIERKTYQYISGTDIEITSLPCVSVEGTSNSAVPSAASFYTMEEANLYLYKNNYLEPIRKSDYSQFELEEFYVRVQNNEFVTVQTYEQYALTPGNALWSDEYKYIQGTFETRWSFVDEALTTANITQEDQNELTFGALKRTLSWMSSVATQGTEEAKKNKFRTEFKKYFSLPYTLAYYLQMQAFIQVDNAGKNAMFDQWGDGIWHIRPYDMDTQMGENNSGDDVISASAEINRNLSPAGITGNLAAQADTSGKTLDATHSRYIEFNTPNSRLWSYFGTYFKDEIQQVYEYLRNSGKRVYTTEYIVAYVESLTSDIIGESFYNKDAGSKYLTQTYYKTEGGVTSIVDNMLTKLQGNRACRYRQICEDRFRFLDTFFSNTSGQTANTSISLRSDAAKTGVYTQQVGISVYSPCYIKVAVGTDVTLMTYIDLNSRYVYNDVEYEGILLTLPLQATNKDITIIGAGNIKSINHMENLLITNFNCANATKLTSIVIANSPALASLSLGSNTYLRTLNLNNSKTLTGSLNLSNCANLIDVDFANTSVTSVSLPANGALETFNASNSKLTSLSFDGLVFLDTINISGCTDIISYSISNCPKISTVDVSGYTGLAQLTINACSAVERLELANTKLTNLSITACDSLMAINLSGCSGTVMNNLNLSTIYNLEDLNIAAAMPANNIKLYLPKYKQEYSQLSAEAIDDLISLGTDVYWHTLKNFDARNSYLRNISYGITQPEDGTCDFSQLTDLESLSLLNCLRILRVTDIHYVGNLYSLLEGCSRLITITGSLEATSTNASRLFYKCSDLTNLADGGLTLSLNLVTDFAYGLAGNINLSAADIKYVLDRLPNVTNLGVFCSMAYRESDLTYPDSKAIVLPANLFTTNTKVTNLSSAFYGTKFTSIPSGFFTPFSTTLISADHAFYYCPLLVTVPANLLTTCTALTTTYSMFAGCDKLENYFGTNYSIFAPNSKVTNIDKMFYNCSKLKASTSSTTGNLSNGLQTFFTNLPALQYGRLAFANTSFITDLPEALFESNVALKDLTMLFLNCATITNLPTALFKSDLTNITTTHPALQYLNGLFCGCTAMTGFAYTHLFNGAENVLEIGHKILNIDSGYAYCAGMFANTSIDGYSYNFLHRLTKLVSASMLFFKGTINGNTFKPTTTGNNNDTLINVYDGNRAYVGVYNGIFNGLTALKDARYIFAGNTSLTDIITIENNEAVSVASPALFADCKATLLSCEGLFAQCTNLAITIPTSLFQNATALRTTRSAFAGCESLTGGLSNTLFTGCNSLQRTDYMFYGCKEIGESSNPTTVAIPSNIFDSCRASLITTAHMFDGCEKLTGILQTGEVTKTTDPEGTIIYTISRYGLLSECVTLNSVEGMFRGCKELHGAIPEDLFFTSSILIRYNNLTNIAYLFDGCYKLGLSNSAYTSIDPRNKQEIYGDALSSEDPGYLVPGNWLSKCPALTTVSYLFRRTSCLTGGGSEYSVPALLLEDGTFSQQTKISTADYAFACVDALAASLTATFMQNSLNTLTNVSDMFAFSNLISAGSVRYNCLFEKNTAPTALNTKLVNITRVFYRTKNDTMSGYLPSISAKFTNVSSFSGAFCNQTQTTNYSDYAGTLYLNSFSLNKDSYRYTAAPYAANAVVD